MLRITTTIAAALCAAGAANASETIRCGKWVVDESVTVSELRRKCGEPTSVRREEQAVRGRPNATKGAVLVGVSVTEYWTYERGTQAPPVLVTIVDGRIRSIERIL